MPHVHLRADDDEAGAPNKRANNTFKELFESRDDAQFLNPLDSIDLNGQSKTAWLNSSRGIVEEADDKKPEAARKWGEKKKEAEAE